MSHFVSYGYQFSNSFKAGNYVKEQILSGFIRLIATSGTDLQVYSARKLFLALRADITQEALTLAGAWVIGEYGDLLFGGSMSEEDDLTQEITEAEVITLLMNIIDSAYTNNVVQEYIMTSLMKLTTRIQDSAQIENIRRLLLRSSDSLDVEIQQRSVEYGGLFGHDVIRRGVLEKMPAPEHRDDRSLGDGVSDTKKAKVTIVPSSTKTPGDDLLDLLSDEPQRNELIPGGSVSRASEILDLFAPQHRDSGQVQYSGPTPVATILDLFDTNTTSQPASTPPGRGAKQEILEPRDLPVYNNRHLAISMVVQRSQDGFIAILAKFRNTSQEEYIQGLSLQVAVPKTQKLQLMPISSTELQPGGDATQQMRIQGSQKVCLYFQQIFLSETNIH